MLLMSVKQKGFNSKDHVLTCHVLQTMDGELDGKEILIGIVSFTWDGKKRKKGGRVHERRCVKQGVGGASHAEV